MPAFPKPSFSYRYRVKEEIAALRRYRKRAPGRQIPKKDRNRLLIATWNIANLGLQKRRPADYRLLAEIIGWFDVIAVQEVNDRLGGLRTIQKYLPARYEVVFSDKAGNDERMAFIFDSRKIKPLELVGEIAVPPKEFQYIRLSGIQRKYNGFDRNPYIASFAGGRFQFILVNVHLYYGRDNRQDRERRNLEAYATARWADMRRKDRDAYVTDIIALGDFNLPKVEPGDLVYRALYRRGLRRPEHSTRISSSIAADKEYDQIMFFPGPTKDRFTGSTGVFDFDGALFRRLWEARTKKQFNAYMRYYISDHRPMWVEFKI